MHTHDPREHVRGLYQILISDKKRLGFLFGAGTSLATGIPGVSIPAIAQMTAVVVESVSSTSDSFKIAIQEIQTEIGDSSFNIESLLSVLETKCAVIGTGKLNGLTASDFRQLADLVKRAILQLVEIHTKIALEDRANLSHAKLARWIDNARRRFPAEIFTTNYDYLFELALEGVGIPYFDGFSGSYEPFFCPEAVEDIDAYPRLVKLWKLHGSLGWTLRSIDKTVIRKQSANDILIYPSHLKYDSSKKQPYVGLIDRLCAFLQLDDAVLFTCGYSFADDHINERIITSLRRGANSHVVAFCYDETKDAAGKRAYALANPANPARRMASQQTGGQMSVYGRRHAIIGGRFGDWRLRDEPRMQASLQVGQYFDEDAASPSDEPGERKGDEQWPGTGTMLLPDFRHLASFLSELSTSNGDAASYEEP